MALQYELVKSNLGNNPQGYHAMVVNQKIHKREELVNMMVNRGSALTKPDIEAALTCLEQVVSQIIQDGEGLHTDIFTIHLNIKGSFPNVDSHFDHSTNKIAINISPNKHLKQLVTDIEVEKVHGSGQEAKIVKIEDVLSGTSNSQLSLSGPVKVLGHRIKVMAAAQPDGKEGLYIISLADNKELEFSTQISNSPGELIYQTPAAIPSGDYKLEVRTYYNGSGRSKNLKIISSAAVLKVS